MFKDIDLMKNYPRTNRENKQRRKEKNIKVRKIEREFEKVFLMKLTLIPTTIGLCHNG